MSTLDARFIGETFRFDRKVVFASNRQLASLLSARLAYDAAGYEAGRVVARNTTSGLFVKYVSGGASGTGTAIGILEHAVQAEDFASSGDTQSAKMIVGGEVLEANCLLLDSNAKTNLTGRSITLPDGTVVFKF